MSGSHTDDIFNSDDEKSSAPCHKVLSEHGEKSDSDPLLEGNVAGCVCLNADLEKAEELCEFL